MALQLQRTVAPGAVSTLEPAILGLRHSVGHHSSNTFSGVGESWVPVHQKKLSISPQSKMNRAWRRVGRFWFGLDFHPEMQNHFIFLTNFFFFIFVFVLSFFVYLF